MCRKSEMLAGFFFFAVFSSEWQGGGVGRSASGVYLYQFYIPGCSHCQQSSSSTALSPVLDEEVVGGGGGVAGREGGQEGGLEEVGGRYSREKTAGNDKGCKYLPLPGPGSCAELTGPLLRCWRMGMGGGSWDVR